MHAEKITGDGCTFPILEDQNFDKNGGQIQVQSLMADS